jgi:uncharacterized RDD family membrane protein YckC
LALQIQCGVPFRHEVKSNTAGQLGAEALNPYASPADTATGAAQPALEHAQLATPSSRLGAHILDMLLLMLAALPGGGLGGLLGASFEFEQDGVNTSGAPALAMGFAGLTMCAFYCYQCYLIAGQGQSLGKRWSYIRIVLEDGSPPGFSRGVLLRSWLLGLMRVIPVVGPVISLVDTLMIFSEGHRCLHDRLAGTRVEKV